MALRYFLSEKKRGMSWRCWDSFAQNRQNHVETNWIHQQIGLVVSRHPSEKYDFNWDDNRNSSKFPILIWENIKFMATSHHPPELVFPNIGPKTARRKRWDCRKVYTGYVPQGIPCGHDFPQIRWQSIGGIFHLKFRWLPMNCHVFANSFSQFWPY